MNPTKNPSLALFALAIGAFGIGVTEFTPMGLLPVIATDLGVTIPTAGLLVSAYAIGVLIGAPLMTLTTGRVPRRTLLIALAGVFTLGNLLAAISDNYAMLLAARIVTSFNHGAFFGVGSVVAAGLVPADKRAGAVATMFMGLTIATIGGVPLATWVGEMVGWRTAFAGIAAIGVATMIALRLFVPPLPGAASGDIGAELRVLARGPVLFALALTMVAFSAMFTVFTYIAPILREAAHASSAMVTFALILFGVGFTAGNWFGGKFADKSVERALITMTALLAVLLALFAAGMHSLWIALVLAPLWGAASFALVPSLQMRVMDAAADAPNLASAMNIGAFNLGNAIGAAIGGEVIREGLGYPAVALAGAVAALAGLAMVLAPRLRSRAAPAAA